MGQPQVRPGKRHAGQAVDSDATRHLCAGTYLDRSFRDTVIRKVHNDSGHRVAPSAGFDLIPVVKHAWRARALDEAEHACLLLILVIGFVTDPPAAVAAACAVGLCYLAPRALRMMSQVLRLHAKASAGRFMRKARVGRDEERLPERARLLAVLVAACAALVIIPLLVASWRHVPAREIVLPAALLLLLMATATVTIAALRQRALNRLHATASLRPATLTRRLAVIDKQQFHTYAVYRRQGTADQVPETDDPRAFSGDHAERAYFFGSGDLRYAWPSPLVIQLLRDGPGSAAEREYTTAPFPAHTLVDHLRQTVEQIGGADATRLPGLEVADRVFVADTDVAAYRQSLQDSPSRLHLNGVIDNPNGPASHYLEIRASASGELVTTVFLGVAIKGRSLNIDLAACALTSTPEDFRRLDAYGESGKGAVLRSMLRGLCNLPTEAGNSWRVSETPVLLAGAVRARRDRTLAPRRTVTIGPRLSIRMDKSTPWTAAYVDEKLILGQIKIIEQRLLNGTEDFLRENNIDTSSFRKKADMVISANVLNIGGRMDVSNSTIGNQAQGNYGGQPGSTGGTPHPGDRS
jgi:hypothetical protein